MDERKNDSNTTLDEIKDHIAQYAKERGWDNLKPRDLAISIVLEASELLEHFQWGDSVDIEANREKIMHEFGDTLNYMLQFAMTLGFDVTTAWREKLDLVKAKYPTTIFNPENGHNNQKYLEIKALHRTGENKNSGAS